MDSIKMSNYFKISKAVERSFALLHTYRTMQVNQCLGIIAFASLYYLWAAANLCENLKSDGYGPNNNGNGDDSCTKVLPTPCLLHPTQTHDRSGAAVGRLLSALKLAGVGLRGLRRRRLFLRLHLPCHRQFRAGQGSLRAPQPTLDWHGASPSAGVPP